MTFSEAANRVMYDFEDRYLNERQKIALKNHTSFLDGITDGDKEKVVVRLMGEIAEYNYDVKWTIARPTEKPTRMIDRDLRIVNAYLDFLDKIETDVPMFYSKSSEATNEGYNTSKVFAGALKHDLELLQKKDNQSDLLLLQKPRYYKITKTKEDIKNTITGIMKEYSIAIDIHSLDSIQNFISRL